MKEVKNCPFKDIECNSSCALFIDPEEFNETVKNKLASVGVVDRKRGACAFKNISLSMSRLIFEKTR